MIERVDEVDTLQEVVANIGFNDVLPVADDECHDDGNVRPTLAVL